MLKHNRKKLGDLLLEVGMITSEQLNKALEVQKREGGKLGEILISEGFVTSKEIVQALEFQLGIPHVNLDKYNIDKSACVLIPENIARRYVMIPIKNESGILTVAMSDPLNVFAIDDIKLYSGLDVQPMVATSEDIFKAIDRYYTTQKAMEAVEEFKKEQISTFKFNVDESQFHGMEDEVNNAPAVKLINSILEQAVRSRASDIHIEPFEKFLKIRFRTDGQLYEVMRSEMQIMPAVTSRIKIVAGMNIAEKRIPQDGRVSIEVDSKEYDLRVSTVPTMFGEKIVIRLIDKAALILPKEKLGFVKEDQEKFENMLMNPHGIILVTGPTGSGKTTTLYSAISQINRPDINIITVEDPVEAKIQGVNQIQVNIKAGLNFASGLRSILRQDPDVILVGEIRDVETAQIAVRAAITGHLVLSTLHTNDAPGAISRLIDMEIEPFLLSSSIIGVVAQRLVKRVCSQCKTTYQADDKELKLLGMEPDEKVSLSKGKGCPVCNGTGHQGRIGVYEVMEVSRKHRELINKRATEDEIREFSIKNGMKTLKDSTKEFVLRGETTIAEFVRISHSN